MGAKRATGTPCSVISIIAPALTASKTFEAFCRKSRTPTDCIAAGLTTFTTGSFTPAFFLPAVGFVLRAAVDIWQE